MILVWITLTLMHRLPVLTPTTSLTGRRSNTRSNTRKNETFGRCLDTWLLSHIPSSPWSQPQPTVCTPGDIKLRCGGGGAPGCRRQLLPVSPPSTLNHCTCSPALIASLIRSSPPQPPIFQPEWRPREEGREARRRLATRPSGKIGTKQSWRWAARFNHCIF